MKPLTSHLTIYRTPDKKINLQVKLENETVWLTQSQISELFGKSKKTISEHISNIFKEKELDENSTVRDFRTVRIEGDREVTRKINFYNLDLIIAIGYRVRSVQGTHFRQWATKRISEYIVKGFTMNDDRLKQEGARSRYFAELQATNGRLMKMKDWIAKLEFFLIGAEKEILQNSGIISHKEAITICQKSTNPI